MRFSTLMMTMLSIGPNIHRLNRCAIGPGSRRISCPQPPEFTWFQKIQVRDEAIDQLGSLRNLGRLPAPSFGSASKPVLHAFGQEVPHLRTCGALNSGVPHNVNRHRDDTDGALLELRHIPGLCPPTSILPSPQSSKGNYEHLLPFL